MAWLFCADRESSPTGVRETSSAVDLVRETTARVASVKAVSGPAMHLRAILRVQLSRATTGVDVQVRVVSTVTDRDPVSARSQDLEERELPRRAVSQLLLKHFL